MIGLTLAAVIGAVILIIGSWWDVKKMEKRNQNRG